MERQRYVLSAAVLLIISFTAGCASAPFPKGILEQTDRAAALDKVRANPGAYRDTLILWGGVILSTQPHEEDTVIEILEKPLDNRTRPKDVDSTKGRFLARVKGFLDPAVFCEGRDITVSGRISGTETYEIGEYPYAYPVISLEKYHLWPQQMENTSPSPYYPVYGPWWWYY